MINFSYINNLEDLKRELSNAKDQSIDLLDNDPHNPANRYFDSLLNCPFINNANHGSKSIFNLFKSIKEAEMQFDANDILDNLFMHHKINGTINKEHDLILDILKSDFAINADSQILGNDLATYYVNHSSNDRLFDKGLKKILDLELLPKQEINDKSILNDNFIDTLNNKINSRTYLKKAITLLSDFDLHNLAEKSIQSWHIQTDIVIDIFAKKNIELNFNTTNSNGISILQIIAEKNLVSDELLRVLEKIEDYNIDIDWSQNFTQGSAIGQNFFTKIFNQPTTTDQIKELLENFVEQNVDISIKDQNGNNALEMIANHLPHHSQDNKYIIHKVAKIVPDFTKTFIAFRESVPIHKLLKAYADKDIDFNTESAELYDALMNPPGIAMPPMPPSGHNTTLLKEIFNRITDEKSFDKVMKLLKHHKNIDWSQDIGGNIIDKIFMFKVNNQNNFIDVLNIAHNDFGLESLSFNSIHSISQIVKHTADVMLQNSVEPSTVLSTINELGYKINSGIFTLEYAKYNQISFTESKSALEVDIDELKFDHVDQNDLPLMIDSLLGQNHNDYANGANIANGNGANIANGNIKNLLMKANFNTLIDMKFSQWEDNFGNGMNFLGATINRVNNLTEVNTILKIANSTKAKEAEIEFNFSHSDNQNRDVIEIIFQKYDQYPGKYEETAKLLLEFDNIDKHKLVYHYFTSPNPGMHMHKNDMVESIFEHIDELDLTTEIRGKQLINYILDHMWSFPMIRKFMLIAKDKYGFNIDDDKYIKLLISKINTDDFKSFAKFLKDDINYDMTKFNDLIPNIMNRCSWNIDNFVTMTQQLKELNDSNVISCDINAKFGENEDSLLSYVRYYNNAKPQDIEHILEDVGFNVTWDYQNKKGEYLFARIISKINVDLLKDTVNYFTSNLTDIEFNKSIDENGNNLLLLIAQGNEVKRWELINELLNQNINIGINHINKAKDRLIDKLKFLIDHKNFSGVSEDALISMIKSLRELGSVEPKSHVLNDNIMLTTDNVETQCNYQSLPKLYNKLHELYPGLNIDTQIQEMKQATEEYVKSHYETEEDRKYMREGDGLNNCGFITEFERLTSLTNQNKSIANNFNWSFKTELAYLWKIASDNNLCDKLINVIPGLHQCEWGRLVQLYAPLTEVIVGYKAIEIDYNKLSEKHGNMLQDEIYSSLQEHFSHNEEEIQQFIVNVYKDFIESQDEIGNILPENWNNDTTKFVGIFNKTIISKISFMLNEDYIMTNEIKPIQPDLLLESHYLFDSLKLILNSFISTPENYSGKLSTILKEYKIAIAEELCSDIKTTQDDILKIIIKYQEKHGKEYVDLSLLDSDSLSYLFDTKDENNDKKITDLYKSKIRLPEKIEQLVKEKITIIQSQKLNDACNSFIDSDNLKLLDDFKKDWALTTEDYYNVKNTLIMVQDDLLLQYRLLQELKNIKKCPDFKIQIDMTNAVKEIKNKILYQFIDQSITSQEIDENTLENIIDVIGNVNFSLIKETDLLKQFIISLSHDSLEKLINNNNIQIDWIKTIKEKHTMLSTLAHKDTDCADLAKLLLSNHTEWDNQIHHDIEPNGDVADNFGDLI